MPQGRVPQRIRHHAAKDNAQGLDADMRRVQQVNAQNAIVIRDTPDKLALAAKIIRDIDKAKPEILIHVQVLTASMDRLRNLGILPGHAPLLTELAPGELEYTSGGANHALVVTWGFAEVLGDRVIVLAQSAERAEEIDLTRAEKAKTRAEERLKRFDDPQVDMERARKSLSRAIARLETAHKHRG